MSRSIKNLLNFQFLLFVILGYVLISLTDRIEHEAAVFLPSLLVMLYGLMVRWGLGDSRPGPVALKRIDSIYLVGFLYSSISLIVLVFRLRELSSLLPDRYLAAIALSYLFISVSTSVSAMAARSLVRRHYVRRKSFGLRMRWA